MERYFMYVYLVLCANVSELPEPVMTNVGGPCCLSAERRVMYVCQDFLSIPVLVYVLHK